MVFFKYLGSRFRVDGNQIADVKARIVVGCHINGGQDVCNLGGHVDGVETQSIVDCLLHRITDNRQDV